MHFGQGVIPKKYLKYDAARAAILSVPYEGTVSYGKGTSKGPRKIIEASRYLEFFDEELGLLNYQAGLTTCPPLKPAATPQKMVEAVRQSARQLLSDEKFIIMLGGEHSISYGLYLALRERVRDLSVLQIDAHADLRTTFQGSPFSHACVMRRIDESCPRTVQVGIRSFCAEEALFIRQKKKHLFMAKDIHGKTDWFDQAIRRLSRNVFLTIDIDGFDPSLVPHTGTPEPGGLFWYETLAFLKRLFEKRNVIAFDLVELAPTSFSAPSDFLAARLVYRLLGYKFKTLLSAGQK
ncbi:MAG: agmatinase [Elusimicrobia bacterium RIFOXYB2_FULL_49_7]|nr:MAG: agmatinase [Elusimicrobia bacterium RIFOXYB2_FULL_49_7]